jgi:ketosteroid isomerase-like protein
LPRLAPHAGRGVNLAMGTTSQVPDIPTQIMALERAALDRWGQGDPGGYLAINAADVTYFDPFVERRLDGITDLTAWYDGIRGTISLDSDEIVNPRVQVIGDAAILTFQYISQTGDEAAYWNCTEVYQRTGDDWRIVHSHWSFTQPELAAG